MKMRKIIPSLLAAQVALAGCEGPCEPGTYAYDLKHLQDCGFEPLELVGADGLSRLIVVPALQGRVMTSTTGGLKAPGYGWINHKYMDEGARSPQFNPYGGEERFWIGPEGGPFSWYFAPGAGQTYANWRVPAGIDTERFEVESVSGSAIVLTHRLDWNNASGRRFIIDVKRSVELVEDAAAVLSGGALAIPDGVRVIAYRTVNTLTNGGDRAWDAESGMPSVWLLGCFTPTPTTTVFIPYDKSFGGKPVNDEYFGKVPADRLVVEDGMVYFKIDGEFRSKIGLPKGSAKDLCGSYDSARKVLTILKYTVPEGDNVYVNGQWGPQDDPFSGDVINSYNDGVTDTGTLMGPFYEIETSSPAARLAPGESLTHTQYTIHMEGPEAALKQIAAAVFGADLDKVGSMFDNK